MYSSTNMQAQLVGMDKPMKIAVINIPFEAPWLGPSAWITVPPQGYGGIQWYVAHLIDGLVALGHEVYLLGAPNSPVTSDRLHVINHGYPVEIRQWLRTWASGIDIIHDHSCGAVFEPSRTRLAPYVGTHHFTGSSRYPGNAVFVSEAQRQDAGQPNAPVVRVPVNPDRYHFSPTKDDFLLFLGRVSPWKGAREAAAFGAAAQCPVVLAGPAWETEYYEDIKRHYGKWIRPVGEVHGSQRLELLSRAKAVLALSQPVEGLWGGIWCEPGATVVSEAAVSGTPVIATDNGCLAEIAGHVGQVIPQGTELTPDLVREVLTALPDPWSIRRTALREWHYLDIAAQYVALYHEVREGKLW